MGKILDIHRRRVADRVRRLIREEWPTGKEFGLALGHADGSLVSKYLGEPTSMARAFVLALARLDPDRLGWCLTGWDHAEHREVGLVSTTEERLAAKLEAASDELRRLLDYCDGMDEGSDGAA